MFLQHNLSSRKLSVIYSRSGNSYKQKRLWVIIIRKNRKKRVAHFFCVCFLLYRHVDRIYIMFTHQQMHFLLNYNETIIEIKDPIFNLPATTLSKYVISWMASYEMLPSYFSSTVSISLRRTSYMSGFIANSYRQNVMVVDVSNPAMKNTKACAATQFMDIPTHSPFYTNKTKSAV